MLVELLCCSLEDIQIAEDYQVDRIELCSAQELGGLTPSIALLAQAKKMTSVPIMAMVRPRSHGFSYSDLEYQVMKEDAKQLLEHGADGLVFGFLNDDGTIHKSRTQEFVNLTQSYQKEAVFHRAFDRSKDPIAAIETLIDCGATRLLTSGQKDLAIDGAPLIHSLIKQYGSKIQILVGAGVRIGNYKEIIKETDCQQIHGSFKKTVIDPTDGSPYFQVDRAQVDQLMKEKNTPQ